MSESLSIRSSGLLATTGRRELSPFLAPAAPLTLALRRPMALAWFLLATAALIVRPGDLFPQLQDWPIYQGFLLLAAALSVPELTRQLSIKALWENPITGCVVGLLGAVVCSHLMRFSLFGVRVVGGEFFKVCVYYLLLVAVLDTPARVRGFLLCVVGCAVAVTVIALGVYFHLLVLPESMSVLQSEIDPDSGALTTVRRLCGIGIFGDPNDLCLLLAVAMAICLNFATVDGARRAARMGWLALTGIFAAAGFLTYSRGGFLGMLAGGAAVMVSRLGWRRGMAIGGAIIVGLFVVLSVRQTRFNPMDPSNTFQTRLRLWNDSITYFRSAPLLGIGAEQHVELAGQVAHNSFLQAFAETGYIGGTLFLAAFALAIAGTRRTAAEMDDSEVQAHTGLSELGRCVVAILVAYAAGLLSLSRTYTVPTYLVVGLAAAYLHIARAEGFTGMPLNTRVVRRLLMLGIAFLIATYAVVRLLGRWW